MNIIRMGVRSCTSPAYRGEMIDLERSLGCVASCIRVLGRHRQGTHPLVARFSGETGCVAVVLSRKLRLFETRTGSGLWSVAFMT